MFEAVKKNSLTAVGVCWAKGLTDRVGSLREVLRYQTPPWSQPQVL